MLKDLEGYYKRNLKFMKEHQINNTIKSLRRIISRLENYKGVS